MYTKVQCGGFYIKVPAFAYEWARVVQRPAGKDRVRREKGEGGFEELLETTTKKPTKAYSAPAFQGLGRSGCLGATLGWL